MGALSAKELLSFLQVSVFILQFKVFLEILDCNTL